MYCMYLLNYRSNRPRDYRIKIKTYWDVEPEIFKFYHNKIMVLQFKKYAEGIP